MKIATVLFTYARPDHTEKVLKALSENIILPSELYIFQDGLKNDKNRSDWNKVNKIINMVDFCPVKIIVNNHNKGLSASIVDGINLVLELNDAVIVLEDDCVPEPYFMTYMTQALVKYKDEEQVFAISGYSYPINLSGEENGSCFIGRMPSWGWASWKSRWSLLYKQDYEILDRINSDYEARQRLAIWGGKDLECMFQNRITGKNDSWAVFWALIAIEKNGKALMPNRSLIKNIGFDGTGVHCGIGEPETHYYEYKGMDFIFPDEIVYDENIKRNFIPLYGTYFAWDKGNVDNEHIYIYGAGSYLRQNCRIIYENYYVEAIIDKNKKGFLGTVPIISLDQISKDTLLKVIIMIENREICYEVAKELEERCGYDESDIIIGPNVIKKEISNQYGKVINIGIMGCGSMAGLMAKTLLKMNGRVELNACASRYKKKADEFAYKYGIKKAYASYQDLVEDDDIDLVYIATPISEHYENMKLCISYKKNVLCEKTFTVNSIQTKKIFALAKKNNVLITEAIWTRYQPLCKKLIEVINSGIIGDINIVTANLMYPIDNISRVSQMSLAGGALLELGIYALTFVSICLGDNISNVVAVCQKNDKGVDYSNAIVLQYPDSKIAIVYSGIGGISDRQGVISGKKGYIVVDNINNLEKIKIYDISRKLIAVYKAPEQISGYEYEVISTIDAIENGQLECVECTHNQTIKMMELMDDIRSQMKIKYLSE